ncbi:MAG: AraC family transcriptional regulator [Spirosomaceae bacterium]|nr:AraC family transcriptional regulator [Spirosomataceae bacterium]
MKTQLETLQIAPEHSFKVMHNPRMSDFFFWHFHPEVELVYIENADGTRHVGTHISRYEHSDLVLIGPHVPHLNFDYGVKTDYEKIVLHVREEFFKESVANIPELSAVLALFDRSRYGVAFDKATQTEVGEWLKHLPFLSHFEQFLQVLKIFQRLAQSTKTTLLHLKPVENQYTKKEQERLRKVYQLIDEQHHRKIEIEEVAQMCHLTKAAFCRYFKKLTRLTFTEFLNHYRVNQAKKLLLQDKNVTETCFECGFESLSYFNRTFKKITNENPLSFKKRYLK